MKNAGNIAASVRQRLLNKARKSSRTFNELFQHFAIERFLYRLSRTPHADKFFLKGALMLRVWGGSQVRPTMDIDLLGRMENSLESMESVMRDACLAVVEDDGLFFATDSVHAVRITEGAEYKGVRVKLDGGLGKARVSIQVDVGFGDVVVPEGRKIQYPVILDFPAPKLAGYTMESTIAEKFQTMIKLGILNSRMKDYYDVWLLSRKFDFNGKLLARAIKATFKQRNTPLDNAFVLFSGDLRRDAGKQTHGML